MLRLAHPQSSLRTAIERVDWQPARVISAEEIEHAPLFFRHRLPGFFAVELSALFLHKQRDLTGSRICRVASVVHQAPQF